LQTCNGNKEVDTRGLKALILKVKQEIFLHTLDIYIICFNCCHSHNKMILNFESITLQKRLFSVSSHYSYSFLSVA